ncbi:uncharacterized protein LOC113497251 isoform X2 [Trichoplusia ni]|uniref:Uncharacterized protein LOC113497251 isoform X2 n=1 Tax=Trichoplusia ni TaxID=7111 RepID=A0A7E5VWD3_TRINI|nr:uncharacterized protein LOC113497251 isoform X2 [Trichoplusia ni]
MREYNLIILVLLSLALSTSAHYVNSSLPKPWRYLYYPKKTVFRKADLIDFGCVTFVHKCPSVYKRFVICARHYDGHYRTFNNYCEMEYENCNSWRQWAMIKQVRC